MKLQDFNSENILIKLNWNIKLNKWNWIKINNECEIYSRWFIFQNAHCTNFDSCDMEIIPIVLPSSKVIYPIWVSTVIYPILGDFRTSLFRKCEQLGWSSQTHFAVLFIGSDLNFFYLLAIWFVLNITIDITVSTLYSNVSQICDMH